MLRELEFYSVDLRAELNRSPGLLTDFAHIYGPGVTRVAVSGLLLFKAVLMKS